MNQAEQGSKLKVVREPGFTRMSIDNVFFAVVGRDIEGALVTKTSEIKSIDRDEATGAADINSEDVHVELARLRLSPEAAFTAMQNLYLVLLTNGLVDQRTMNSTLAGLEQFISDPAADARHD